MTVGGLTGLESHTYDAVSQALYNRYMGAVSPSIIRRLGRGMNETRRLPPPSFRRGSQGYYKVQQLHLTYVHCFQISVEVPTTRRDVRASAASRILHRARNFVENRPWYLHGSLTPVLITML